MQVLLASLDCEKKNFPRKGQDSVEPGTTLCASRGGLGRQAFLIVIECESIPSTTSKAKSMPTEQEIEEALDGLRGPREVFRKALTDKDKLLSYFMTHAEKMAKKQRLPVWSIVGEITGHGSGVLSAIYELYRRKPENNQA